MYYGFELNIEYVSAGFSKIYIKCTQLNSLQCNPIKYEGYMSLNYQSFIGGPMRLQIIRGVRLFMTFPAYDHFLS